MQTVRIALELSEAQYKMLLDCLNTAEVKVRFEATALASENTNYANRIRYLREMIEKTSVSTEDPQSTNR